MNDIQHLSPKISEQMSGSTSTCLMKRAFDEEILDLKRKFKFDNITTTIDCIASIASGDGWVVYMGGGMRYLIYNILFGCTYNFLARSMPVVILDT